MRVKICGIASEEDVRAVSAAGVDYAGFLVGLDYLSADAVSSGEATRLSRLLPPKIAPVLVTHRKTVPEVVALAAACAFPTLQLHGELPAEWVPDLRWRLPTVAIWRAVHVEDEAAIVRAAEVARWVDAVVLDTRTADRIGGTGRVHDWSISAEIVRTCGKPVILAGGLTPENIATAIARVRPWGVDVNTGVEDAAGRKDPDRLRRFLGDIPR